MEIIYEGKMESTQDVFRNYLINCEKNFCANFRNSFGIAFQLCYDIKKVISMCIANEDKLSPIVISSELSVIISFVQSVESAYIISMKNLDNPSFSIANMINEIKILLKSKCSPLDGLVQGFKSTVDVHEHANGIFYHQLKMHFRRFSFIFKRNFPTLAAWSPVGATVINEAMFAIRKISDGEIMLEKQYIAESKTDEMIPDYYRYRDLRLRMNQTTAFTLDEVSSNLDTLLGTSSKVIIPQETSFCNSVTELVAMARDYQNRMWRKIRFDRPIIDYIFLMSNTLLIKAVNMSPNISFIDLDRLLTCIYSILDKILPNVVRILNNVTSVIDLAKECTYVYNHTHILCDKKKVSRATFEEYINILYKYLVFHILPTVSNFPEWPFFFTMKRSNIYIYRLFKPNVIESGSVKTFWKAKFDVFKRFEEFMKDANPKRVCVICSRTMEKPEEVAILEECNHTCCVKCLMQVINFTSDELKEGRRVTNSFMCPHSSCPIKHMNFITGSAYKQIRDQIYSEFGEAVLVSY